MSKLNIEETLLKGVFVVTSDLFKDQRGAFLRLFCNNELSDIIKDRQILQINHSRTVSVGAIRGMHYQNLPHAEMKLIRCLRGRVWDVAIDLRKGSPTFLKWYSEELSPENSKMMIIPEGFAHGFQVLEPNSELLYLHTEIYSPQSESGLRYNDPLISIDWPLKVTDLSKRDEEHLLLTESFNGLNL